MRGEGKVGGKNVQTGKNVFSFGMYKEQNLFYAYLFAIGYTRNTAVMCLWGNSRNCV